MSLSVGVDRFDYVEGSWLFWSEHHAGQWSAGYQRLCRYQFNPGPCWKGWESLSETARDVYRAWCRKENEACTYDTVKGLLELSDNYDLEDPCVDQIVSRYGDELLEDTGLVNFDHSDWVNCAMCYCADLRRFYDQCEDSILYWLDELCDALGYNSRLQAVEGDTIETPGELKEAFVNAAMTYLARLLLDDCRTTAEDYR